MIWLNAISKFYFRMKCVEIVLNGLNETNHILSDFEIKLASFGEMPSELEALKTVTNSYMSMCSVHCLKILVYIEYLRFVQVHKELLSLQNSLSMQQPVIDQLLEDGHNTRRLVEKSRHHFHSNIHHDLDRLDSDLNKVSVRWNNICSQLVDRWVLQANYFVFIFRVGAWMRSEGSKSIVPISSCLLIFIFIESYFQWRLVIFIMACCN